MGGNPSRVLAVVKNHASIDFGKEIISVSFLDAVNIGRIASLQALKDEQEKVDQTFTAYGVSSEDVLWFRTARFLHTNFLKFQRWRPSKEVSDQELRDGGEKLLLHFSSLSRLELEAVWEWYVPRWPPFYSCHATCGSARRQLPAAFVLALAPRVRFGQHK